MVNNAATLLNTVITNNRANIAGSGLYIGGSNPRLLHTTIARNTGGDGNGVYVTEYGGYAYSTVALTNTILVSQAVGISVTQGNAIAVNGILWHGTPITVSHATLATAIVQNQRQGDPAFAADGYHILANSAAIDVGVDAGVRTDIDNEPRPYKALDLGADEYWPSGAPQYVYLPLVLRQSP